MLDFKVIFTLPLDNVLISVTSLVMRFAPYMLTSPYYYAFSSITKIFIYFKILGFKYNF
ncbi:MAG: hypothetical protein K0R02_676 [Rickettsiaceae bacterium]|jgi:hypothetical protein|nr:hypothetical protein [Rickettsiaceae bacterium]